MQALTCTVLPVTHVKVENGEVSSSLMAHEIGRNLGLWHAEGMSRSEKPISEDGDVIEYGNPYSVMGSANDIVTGEILLFPAKWPYMKCIKRIMGMLIIQPSFMA